jgi:microcystin-dependent protein
MADPAATNPDADGLVGGCTPYFGETLPSPKYRWAHGTQTLSRTEFSLLFSRLGELWGPGDGSTTFNLPDCDKLVLVGVDSTGVDTDFDAVGNTGGSKAATMPTHSHGSGTLGITPNPHTHSYEAVNTSGGVTTGGSGAHTPASYTTGGTSLDIDGSTADSAGSGDNMPPFATVRYLIKVL